MDDLDQRLIAELRINSRASVPTLATILGVARGTVRTRLEKLISSGIITGFTIQLREEERKELLRAFVLIELSARNIRNLGSIIKRIPGVVMVATTNGQWDLIAELEVSSLAAFGQTIQKIRVLDGVSKSESFIIHNIL